MPILPGLIVFATAFAVTYAMVPVSKYLAEQLGAIDFPGERRVNEQAIPRAGGIALYAGFLAGCAALYILMNAFPWPYEDLYSVRGVDYVLLFLGLSIVFIVGLIDDVSPLSPRSKLAGQIVAAVIICLSGITIGSFRFPITGDYITLGWLDLPVSIVYFLVFMNAINLIDGLDGLAAGITAIVSTGLLYLVGIRGSITLAMCCLMVIAICLAFLRFNFNPASIFMGDSGSLLLGTLLAIISVSGVARTQGLAVFIVPLVIAGVPVLDTGTAIIRRIREGKRIDEADMEHVHHRMMAYGMSHRRTVLILYGFSAVLAIIGCVMGRFSGPTRWTIVIVLGAVVFYIIARMHLLDPVLHHYYRRRKKAEPRRDTNKTF